MNIVLEFHDSQVSGMESVTGNLLIHFSSAHVRHWSAPPKADASEGYVQVAVMELEEAICAGPYHECTGKLVDGQLFIDGQLLLHVPIPYKQTGEISVELTFANTAALTVSAKSIHFYFDGEPRFVESFAC